MYRQTLPAAAALAGILLAGLACGGSTATSTTLASQPTSSQAAGIAPDAALPRGERVLGIDVSEAEDGDYNRAFSLAREAGMQVTSLSLSWDDIEISPGVYEPDPDFLTIANLYYPQVDTALNLGVHPLDTAVDRRPADLQDKPFDDPEVIQRYKLLLDYVFSQIPDLELESLAIGNEIDGVLGGDPAAWQAYGRFFEVAAAHARSLRPEVDIGTKIMYAGLMSNAMPVIRPLHDSSDVVMATYYPLNPDFGVRPPEVVIEDLAALVAAYPEKPILLLEVGYPSSPLLESSEAKQAEFIRHLFEAWDNHPDAIRLISITWLTDTSEDSLAVYADYYGLADENFIAFLATLGLRNRDGAGSDKPAFQQLRLEAQARGW